MAPNDVLSEVVASKPGQRPDPERFSPEGWFDERRGAPPPRKSRPERHAGHERASVAHGD